MDAGGFERDCQCPSRISGFAGLREPASTWAIFVVPCLRPCKLSLAVLTPAPLHIKQMSLLDVSERSERGESLIPSHENMLGMYVGHFFVIVTGATLFQYITIKLRDAVTNNSA